jgi:hypothetical protein
MASEVKRNHVPDYKRNRVPLVEVLLRGEW